jgi:transcriptional regulator NrdR family protein
MVCIYCGHKTKTTNSREKKRDKGVWRRRLCPSCQATFTTHEGVDWTTAIAYKTDTGHIEPFSRDKLFVSIHDSLKHRKDATETATALTDTILVKTIAHITDATVNRHDLVAISTKVLKNFDKAAATTYQAYHPI